MTDTIDTQKVGLFRSEILVSLHNKVRALKKLANEASTDAEAVRLVDKAAGLQSVLDEQTDRLLTIETPAEGLTLAAFILGVASMTDNEARRQGVTLAADDILSFFR